MRTTAYALKQPTRFRCRLTSRSEVKCAIAHGRNQNRLLTSHAIARGWNQNRSIIKCAIARGRNQNRVMMRGGRI